jgi:hypothetical protein
MEDILDSLRDTGSAESGEMIPRIPPTGSVERTDPKTIANLDH